VRNPAADAGPGLPGEQLGNEKECIEALQLGYLAMTKTSALP
jgi:TRAP-type C4-dicarboxylate transport system substrate-binding protein